MEADLLSITFYFRLNKPKCSRNIGNNSTKNTTPNGHYRQIHQSAEILTHMETKSNLSASKAFTPMISSDGIFAFPSSELLSVLSEILLQEIQGADRKFSTIDVRGGIGENCKVSIGIFSLKKSEFSVVSREWLLIVRQYVSHRIDLILSKSRRYIIVRALFTELKRPDNKLTALALTTSAHFFFLRSNRSFYLNPIKRRETSKYNEEMRTEYFTDSTKLTPGELRQRVWRQRVGIYVLFFFFFVCYFNRLKNAFRSQIRKMDSTCISL